MTIQTDKPKKLNQILQGSINQAPLSFKGSYWLIIVVLFALLLLIFGYLIWQNYNSLRGTTLTQKDKISRQFEINDNEFFVSKVITNLTKFSEGEKTPAFKMPGKYEVDIGILLASLYQCPTEAWSMKIIGGPDPHGIDYLLGSTKTILYILPRLNSAICKKGTIENQYKLYIKWEGRGDRDWVIVVPGYSGTQNAYKKFPMFVENITKDSEFNQLKAIELQEYLQNNVITNEHSLLNGPAITSAPHLSFDRHSNQIQARINFIFASSCHADVNMELDTQIWKYDKVVYVWARPITKSKSDGPKFCPLIVQPRVKKQMELSIPVPPGVSSATILIPDYPGGEMFVKKITP